MEDNKKAEKIAIKNRVKEILDDYLMDKDETYAYISLYFEKGEENQEKRLVFGEPSPATPDLYRDLPEGYCTEPFISITECLFPDVIWCHFDGTPWDGRTREEIFKKSTT